MFGRELGRTSIPVNPLWFACADITLVTWVRAGERMVGEGLRPQRWDGAPGHCVWGHGWVHVPADRAREGDRRGERMRFFLFSPIPAKAPKPGEDLG